MYKDKEKQKEANKEASRRYRQGMTPSQGMTESPTSEGMTGKQGMTQYPGIIDILTDRKKRAKLEKIVQAFKESHQSMLLMCTLACTARLCWKLVLY